MAYTVPISPSLKSFQEIYGDGNYSGMISHQSNVVSALNETKNILNSTIEGFGRAGSDAQCAALKSWVTLARDGVDRLSTSINNDIDGLFSNGKQINDIIKDIEDYKRQGEEIAEGIQRIFEGLYNETIGSFNKPTEVENARNEQEKLSLINKHIERLNRKGEAQLQAMSDAINAVKLGVIGNMHKDGSLGAYIKYENGYHFDGAEWDRNNPTVQLNIFQNVGCVVVGAVEGVAKVAEGIVDLGTSAVAGVVSIFNNDAGNAVANFAKMDLSNMLFGGIASLFTGSRDAYNDSWGAKLGKFTGSTIAHGVLWASGLGLLSATSVAGTTTETGLKDGKGIGSALLGGVISGGLTFIGGKVIGEVTSRIAPGLGNWITNSGNPAARLIRAGATSFKGWGNLSLGGKFVSLVASPLRGYTNFLSKSIEIGANTVGKALAGTHIGKFATKLDNSTSNLISKGLDKLFPNSKPVPPTPTSKKPDINDPKYATPDPQNSDVGLPGRNAEMKDGKLVLDADGKPNYLDDTLDARVTSERARQTVQGKRANYSRYQAAQKMNGETFAEASNPGAGEISAERHDAMAQLGESFGRGKGTGKVNETQKILSDLGKKINAGTATPEEVRAYTDAFYSYTGYGKDVASSAYESAADAADAIADAAELYSRDLAAYNAEQAAQAAQQAKISSQSRISSGLLSGIFSERMQDRKS